MSKRETQKAFRAGRFAWREDDGRIREIQIVRPAKRPSSTSIAEIRRAIRDTHGTGKKK
jgi:hypothetical protein